MNKSLISRISFVFLTAMLIGGFPNYMIQEAHAATFTSALVNDANNDSESANIGDTIVLSFASTNVTSGGTMTSAEIIANFTSATSSLFTDGAYTGAWTGTTVLTITITTAGFADPPIIGDTIAYSSPTGHGIGEADNTDLDATAIALTGDFGLIPDVTSAVWDDPDNGDSVFGAGDTLTLTFDTPTDETDYGSKAAVDAVMTITGLSGGGNSATYSATWSSSTVLVVTITDPDTATPTVGSSVIGITTATGVVSSEGGSTGEWSTTFGSTTGDFGDSSGVVSNGGGSGCNDCEAPTLGIDKRGTKLVSNGFTYNGHSIDVERFFTPYPLITVDVGKQNKAEFKIYENQGIENIKHFSFAFGLGDDQIISESKAMIELDIDYDGTETVTITDPENALDNVRVETSHVSCDSDEQINCLGVTIYHTFRAPLDFNIVATDVWDFKRNAWQNYYNHGIEVVGESLNPPKEYDGINKGQIYHLTETSKTTAVDEFDNSWSLEYGVWVMDYIANKKIDAMFLKKTMPVVGGYAGVDQYGQMYHLTETSKTTAVDEFDNSWSLEYGVWVMDYISNEKIINGITQNGIDRNNAWFNIYKQGQELSAKVVLEQYCPSCSDEEFAEINDIFSYEFPKRTDKLLDPEIQNKMLQESKIAGDTLQQIFDSLYGNYHY